MTSWSPSICHTQESDLGLPEKKSNHSSLSHSPAQFLFSASIIWVKLESNQKVHTLKLFTIKEKHTFPKLLLPPCLCFARLGELATKRKTELGGRNGEEEVEKERRSRQPSQNGKPEHTVFFTLAASTPLWLRFLYHQLWHYSQQALFRSTSRAQ